jgi:hypothetical protein
MQSWAFSFVGLQVAAEQSCCANSHGEALSDFFFEDQQQQKVRLSYLCLTEP